MRVDLVLTPEQDYKLPFEMAEQEKKDVKRGNSKEKTAN
jgi:hypothetical protein